jgi:F-type H+-transporting ATPase subunit delta
MNLGASRDALAAAVDELERVLEDGRTNVDALGGELFAVGRLLAREISLRRALADPSRTGDERADMFDEMLSSQLAQSTRNVVRAAVRERWASPSDLAGAFEDLGVRAVVASADADGKLDRLEDELFRFRRIMLADQRLRAALTGESDAARRAALLDDLIGSKVTPQTRTLIDEAVAAGSSRTVEHTLEHFSAVAAARRERLVAHVRSVIELTSAQRERLATALAKMYGRRVALQVETDPSVLGGLSIQLGDEVLDATVLARLEEARRRLAG